MEKAKRKAYEASRLPSDWPSYLHNKCNVPTCFYPNAPQAADGTFNCRGYWNGSYCEGTYYVSPSIASSVMKNYKDQMARENRAKWNAKQAAEMEHPKLVKAYLDEEARRMAAEELAAKYDELRRFENTLAGARADDLSPPAYLVRKVAQRRRPANTKPTNTNTKYIPASYKYNSPQYRYTESQTCNYQHGKSPSRSAFSVFFYFWLTLLRF